MQAWTPGFRKWFDGSVTTDKSGCPLVFYRGQRRVAKPDQFITRLKRGLASFTPIPEVASLYAATPHEFFETVEFRRAANVAPYFIRMANPLDVRHLGTKSSLWAVIECLPWDLRPEPASYTFDWNALIELVYGFQRLQVFYNVDFEGDARDWGDLERMVEEACSQSEDYDIFEDFECELGSIEIDLYALADNPFLADVLGLLGYDGIIHKDTIEAGAKHILATSGKSVSDIGGIDLEDDFAFDTYRPFSQAQVKSVFNCGAFNADNPDVLK